MKHVVPNPVLDLCLPNAVEVKMPMCAQKMAELTYTKPVRGQRNAPESSCGKFHQADPINAPLANNVSNVPSFRYCLPII